ncbi:MAG: hypothetical protein HQM08_27375 [Candidatus Riflebacteria bacterium]|nr:hypothetical protein [Candidatus Riflebacteria bacterium]
MTRLSLSVSEQDYKSFKTLSLISGKSMSKLFSDWIKRVMRTKKIDDPLLKAFLEAPQDDEPYTDEQKKAVEEARRDKKISWDELDARLENLS